MRSRREFEVANIPACLTYTQQWVYWNYVIRDGKETKLPMDANTELEEAERPMALTLASS